MTSLCDVMRISCARKGRELYKESMTKHQGLLLLLSGCSGTKHLGFVNKPQTLYSAVSVLFKEEA